MAFLERDREIVRMRVNGVGPTEIARLMRLSKNTVIGIIHRRAPYLTEHRGLTVEKARVPSGTSREERAERREALAQLKAEIAEINADASAFSRVDDGHPIPTLDTRLDALHARMDAVLAATLDVGRVKEKPKSL